ncbi:MAG: hydroxymyristoyl-ACP dehydratase [Candidatus Competibacteraceae bacterium]|nr:hydroxymyristoyl-ACP dehydratase [Candidatus Competibacteraceae bacterium]
MLIDKARIRELIPHTGAMCLLDTVIAWDDDSIQCVTDTHRDSANPLRRRGRLPAVVAFEYGAQAAAVHGGLRASAAGESAAPGYLAALRNACWFVSELDENAAPLEVTAHRLLGEAAHCIYAIQISSAGQLLAEARITIVPQTHGKSP